MLRKWFINLFRFRSLNYQLAWLFIFLLLIVLSVFGGVAYWMASLSLETELGRRLETVARLNTPALEKLDPVSLVPGGETTEYVRGRALRFVSRANLESIQVLRSDGTVLIDTADEKAEGKPYDYLQLYRTEWERALRGESVSTPLFPGRGGRLFKSAFAPFGSPVMVLRVEASADFLSEVRRFGGSLLLLGCMSLVLAVALAAFVSRPIVAPLRQLIAASRRVAGGDFGSRVEVRRHDEIGQMSSTFNEMTEQLERFVREKERLATLGELAAGVVHEVRNPLAAIEGFADLMARRLRKTDPSLAHLREIKNEVRIVNGFLSEFLDYAKPRPPKIEPLDPAESVAAAMPVVFPGDKARKWRVGWGRRERLAVLADKDQLRQVMVNLLMNAAEASPKGGRISIACVKNGAAARLSVKDEGKGISSADREKLFTPFFTSKPMGTGLGLSIASKIVEGFGGSIEVESEEGKGSVFTVVMPLAST